jgi:glycosyltransferase involved in cell wall biosynthesis
MLINSNLSVVIPAYNEVARVGSVVRSALQYASEVIVVDDGSADETGAAASAAGARVIRQDNAGYIAAVKRGFSRGDGRCGGDDGRRRRASGGGHPSLGRSHPGGGS